MVEYVGEINEEQKQEFLGNAKALLFPIDWPEPFGLVMIEAMACGTPVIAWNNGYVSEIIDNGKSGQSIGKRSAFAFPRKSCFCSSLISPTYSTKGCLNKC